MYNLFKNLSDMVLSFKSQFQPNSNKKNLHNVRVQQLNLIFSLYEFHVSECPDAVTKSNRLE